MKTAREWIAEWLEPVSSEDDELDDMVIALESRERDIRAEAFADVMEIFRGVCGDEAPEGMTTVLLMIWKRIERLRAGQ